MILNILQNTEKQPAVILRSSVLLYLQYYAKCKVTQWSAYLINKMKTLIKANIKSCFLLCEQVHEETSCTPHLWVGQAAICRRQ